MISYTRTAKPCPQTHTANPEGWQSSRSSVSSTTPQHYVDGKNQKTLNIMLMEKPSRPDHCGQSNHCGGFCPWGRYASCVHSRSVLLSDLKTDHVERPFGSVLRQLHQLLVLWLYLGAGGTYVKHIWRHLCQKYLEASMSKKYLEAPMPKLSGDTYANNIPRHLCQTYLEAPMSNNIWRHLCQTIWRHLCQKYLEARMPKLSGGTYVNIIWRHQCQTNVWRHPSTTPIRHSTCSRSPTLRPTQHLLAGWFSN